MPSILQGWTAKQEMGGGLFLGLTQDAHRIFHISSSMAARQGITLEEQLGPYISLANVQFASKLLPHCVHFAQAGGAESEVAERCHTLGFAPEVPLTTVYIELS